MHKVDHQDASTLGRGIAIKGRITGDGSLVIQGNVDGEIAIQGDLTIDADANVQGSVDATAIAIDGSFDGDIAASGPVRANAGSVVRGTVSGASFSMDDGAVVSATISADFDLPEELRTSRR